MFVKKSTYNNKVEELELLLSELRDENDKLLRHNNSLINSASTDKDMIRMFKEQIQGLIEENEVLTLNVAEYEKTVNHSDSTHIYLDISDSLQRVTPTVRYKPEVFEKLVECGILNDTHDSPYAIQIGLMIVARDAIEYIIEQSQENFVDKSTD